MGAFEFELGDCCGCEAVVDPCPPTTGNLSLTDPCTGLGPAFPVGACGDCVSTTRTLKYQSLTSVCEGTVTTWNDAATPGATFRYSMDCDPAGPVLHIYSWNRCSIDDPLGGSCTCIEPSVVDDCA